MEVRLDRVVGLEASADSSSFSCNAKHAPVAISGWNWNASTRFSLGRLQNSSVPQTSYGASSRVEMEESVEMVADAEMAVEVGGSFSGGRVAALSQMARFRSRWAESGRFRTDEDLSRKGSDGDEG